MCNSKLFNNIFTLIDSSLSIPKITSFCLQIYSSCGEVQVQFYQYISIYQRRIPMSSSQFNECAKMNEIAESTPISCIVCELWLILRREKVSVRGDIHPILMERKKRVLYVRKQCFTVHAILFSFIIFWWHIKLFI